MGVFPADVSELARGVTLKEDLHGMGDPTYTTNFVRNDKLESTQNNGSSITVFTTYSTNDTQQQRNNSQRETLKRGCVFVTLTTSEHF